MKRLWYRLVWLWSWRQRRKHPRHNSKWCDTCTAGDFCMEVYCNAPLVIDEVGPPVPSDCLRLYDGSVVKFGDMMNESSSVPLRIVPSMVCPTCGASSACFNCRDAPPAG